MEDIKAYRSVELQVRAPFTPLQRQLLTIYLLDLLGSGLSRDETSTLLSYLLASLLRELYMLLLKPRDSNHS